VQAGSERISVRPPDFRTAKRVLSTIVKKSEETHIFQPTPDRKSMSDKLHTPRRWRVHPGSLFIAVIAAALCMGANLAPRATSDLESVVRLQRESGERLRSLIDAGPHTDYGFPCIVYRSYDSRTTLITTDGQIVTPLERRSGEWQALGLIANLALGALLVAMLLILSELIFVRRPARADVVSNALVLPEV
jgi:hypothetical protein